MTQSHYFNMEIKDTGLPGIYRVVRDRTGDTEGLHLSTDELLSMVNHAPIYGGIVVMGTDGKDKISIPDPTVSGAGEEEPSASASSSESTDPLSMVSEIFQNILGQSEQSPLFQDDSVSWTNESEEDDTDDSPHVIFANNLTKDQLRRLEQATTMEDVYRIIREANE